MHGGLRVPSEILVTFSPRNSYEREKQSKKHFSFTPDEAAPCCYYPATSFSPSAVNIYKVPILIAFTLINKKYLVDSNNF